MGLIRSRAGACAPLCAMLLSTAVCAHAQPKTHSLRFSQPSVSTDDRGRVITVARVKGDIPGVLTVAVATDAQGHVTGGEWALDVSYVTFGAIDPDGDGDRIEGIAQKGVIKGNVRGGSATLDSQGHATSLKGVQLELTGATMRYSHIHQGTGTYTVSGLTSPAHARGTASLRF